MPRVDNVIVFGDSLSDIGRKWVTFTGKAARLKGEMTVNHTGRFSDCRNWTDFMIEAAGAPSLMVDSASQSETNSKRHLSLTENSLLLGTTANRFYYANYAEGGACGDTPHTLSAFLGTFKEQVDLYQKRSAN